MELSEAQLDFVRTNHSAAMITVRKDGSSHVARITTGVVDGKVWVSGTQTRVRTKHLRTNPKGTLFVFAQDGSGNWLGIEGAVTIHEGPEAPQKNLQLHRAVGREPEDIDAYLQSMRDQGRLIYEFQAMRTYGRWE